MLTLVDLCINYSCCPLTLLVKYPVEIAQWLYYTWARRAVTRSFDSLIVVVSKYITCYPRTCEHDTTQSMSWYLGMKGSVNLSN